MQAVLEKTSIKPLKAHHHTLQLMGCGFVLTAIHKNPQIAWDALRAGVAEIERIERLISSWREDSQTGLINKMAGIAPVQVDKELFELIERCLKISHITQGAFDISGTLSRYYWKFDKSTSQMPSDEKLAELKDLMNYHNIILDQTMQTVFLKKAGMKIGFGAIGKGYAALRAKIIMEHMGIQNGLVNASGDLMCWGKPIKDQAWKVSIPNLENPGHILAEFYLPNGAVVTSGGHENYALINGKRYSHIIDPRTGMPVEGLKSVSIICPNPELGDALATAVTVLGAARGLALVNRLDGVECLLITHEGEKVLSENLT